MPIVNVKRDELFAKIGKVYTDEEFGNLCFEFGIENDDIVTESTIKGKDTKDPDAIWYKIDVPANRYDLLCIEGIARALRIFLELENPPTYKVVRSRKDLLMIQDKSTFNVRPFVVCAVLRGIKMTQEIYNSFIDLQDKLHFNIGRRRTLVAIGTHDLDLIQAPFTYTTQTYDEIKFVALNESKERNVSELFNYYCNEKENSHLKPYLDIAAQAQTDRVKNGLPLVHPVIRDARGKVLSLPPVINSEYSKISLDTKNIFIECTGTDYTKTNIVLNTICAMFSEYCTEPFTIEAVNVQTPNTLPLPPATTPVKSLEHRTDNNVVYSYPDMIVRNFETTVSYLNAGLGLKLNGDEICSLLKRMQLEATYDVSTKAPSDTVVYVKSPCTRSDVLHPIDIQEDVAIAYGYDNLPISLPPVNTIGKELPLNKLTDQIRQVVAFCQYTEVMTWALIQVEENFEKLGRTDDGKTCVTLANSKTDFTACRTTMIPGLLKVLQANKSVKLPVRIFEAGDIVLIDEKVPEGARNERHIGALYAGLSSGFEEIHGVLSRIMEQLDCAFVSHLDFKPDTKAAKKYYTIRPSETEGKTYIKERSADIVLSTGVVLGQFGILHPDVLKHFNLEHHASVSVLDMNIEPF